ncbi:MAG: hypothetical protein GXO56_03545 [Chloroflexi bacterium]|nr:hypothetical protein [Chloroflexota bacterium]
MRGGLVLAVLLWLLWALWTLPAVPFHPDESTYLFMAADGQAWGHPQALAYTGEGGLREHYRLVNAPLTRYLFALGLAVHGQSPLAQDWDWSASWEANVARGALPSEGQLIAARQVATLCTALAGLLLALVACRLGGTAVAWLTLIGFLLNPLVLLHGRRAMMEAPMLLGIAWVLWELTAERPKAWRLGLALAWAIWAKYWTLALWPVALWAVWRRTHGPKRRWRALAVVLGLPLVVGLILQPVMWHAPWQTALAMLHERLQVTATQQATFRSVLPSYAPTTPWQRLGLLLGQIYLAPLAYLDLGKYQAPLQTAIDAYNSHLWAHWGRGILGAAVQLGLTLVGVYAMLRQVKETASSSQGWALRAFLVAAAAQWGWMLLTLPLAFQRYALPVLPFVVVWEAWGLWWLLRKGIYR